MIKYSKDKIEIGHAIVELFVQMGWERVYGTDAERNRYSPLYDFLLEASVRRLNPHAPETAINEALLQLRNFENADLKKQNALFTEYLQSGIEISMPRAVMARLAFSGTRKAPANLCP